MSYTGKYNQYPSHHGPQHVQPSSVDQGEFPPAPIDFIVNWADPFLTSLTTSTSVALPIQTSSLSALSVLPKSSRTLPVAAPIPIPHAALTKAALLAMMSFDDKGSINSIPLTKKLNWHLQDKENDTHNYFAGGIEPLKISIDARTRGDFDNRVLHPNSQAVMNYNAFVNSGNSKQTAAAAAGRSKLVIRPISPSTLIALTEPCLMAWCTAFDENSAEPGSSAAYLPFQSSDCNNYVDKKNKAVYNAWGY